LPSLTYCPLAGENIENATDPKRVDVEMKAVGVSMVRVRKGGNVEGT